MNSEVKNLKEFLDFKASFYNEEWFVAEDPVSIPHKFSQKNDIEISAFLTSLISWGRRKAIVNSASKMMELFDMAPYDFVVNHNENDLKKISKFVYRTFNGQDLCELIGILKTIYTYGGGLEAVFNNISIYEGLVNVRKSFFTESHSKHLEKHISNVEAGAAAKRLNMFLRWMVRNDKHGVDFGLWKHISPASLYIPLDLHTGRVARSLGLLQRNCNDWKAVVELTDNLRQFDPDDPVKYDFALFGLGIYEGFN